MHNPPNLRFPPAARSFVDITKVHNLEPLPLSTGARLERALPNARRYILPDSGHAAMLERGFDLARVMRATGFAGDMASTVGPTDTLPLQSEATVGRRRQPKVSPDTAGAHRQGIPSPRETATANAPSTVPLSSGFGSTTARTGQGALEKGCIGSAGQSTSSSQAVSLQADEDGHLRSAEALPEIPAAALNAVSLGLGTGSLGHQPLVRGQVAGAAALVPEGSDKESAGGGGSASRAGGKGKATVDVNSAFDNWCQKLAPWRVRMTPCVGGSMQFVVPCIKNRLLRILSWGRTISWGCTPHMQCRKGNTFQAREPPTRTYLGEPFSWCWSGRPRFG